MSETVINNGTVPRISPWRAVLRVLTDPAETFRAIAEKPPVLVPYLVHMAAGLIYAVLAFNVEMEFAEKLRQQMLDRLAASGQIDISAVPATSPLEMAMSMASGVLVGPWLTGFALALIALFFGQFQGGGVPLTSYMGMIGYARMPLAILWLLQGGFAAVTGQRLNLSAAAFLPEPAGPWLTGFLSALNPLHIWYYFLLGIGFAALFGREPRKGWALPVTLFVLTTLGGTASLVVNERLMNAFMNLN